MHHAILLSSSDKIQPAAPPNVTENKGFILFF